MTNVEVHNLTNSIISATPKLTNDGTTYDPKMFQSFNWNDFSIESKILLLLMCLSLFVILLLFTIRCFYRVYEWNWIPLPDCSDEEYDTDNDFKIYNDSENIYDNFHDLMLNMKMHSLPTITEENCDDDECVSLAITSEEETISNLNEKQKNIIKQRFSIQSESEYCTNEKCKNDKRKDEFSMFSKSRDWCFDDAI